MKFKEFFKNGVLAVVMAATVTGAFSQPISVMQEAPNRSEIVKVIKGSIAQEDLAYLIQKGAGFSDIRTEAVYKKINESIGKRYGFEKLEELKRDLEKELREVGAYKNIEVLYSWSMPKEILEEYPTAKQNDSSIAKNGIDVSAECSVEMKVAVDDNGRLFEASELAYASTEEISGRSAESLTGVLKEAIAHELSHCVLQADMKREDFEVDFSKDFKEAHPEVAKIINGKINSAKEGIASKNFDDINSFDYLLFINYNENFADVSGAFARLGNNPSQEKIQEVRGSLLEVAKLRESTGLTHKTQAAVQYALEKLDDAAKMSPETRLQFAKEIAGDTLLTNMKIIFDTAVRGKTSELFGSFLVGGLDLDDNGRVVQKVPEGQAEKYISMVAEYENMESQGNKLGSVGQEIYSHTELIAKYQSIENNNPAEKFKFNYDAVRDLREKANHNSNQSKLGQNKNPLM